METSSHSYEGSRSNELSYRPLLAGSSLSTGSYINTDSHIVAPTLRAH